MDNLDNEENERIEKINKILEINRIARLNYLIRRAEGRTLIKHIPLELQKKRGRKPLKYDEKAPIIVKEKQKVGRKVKNINSYVNYELFNLKLTPIRKTRGRPPKKLLIEYNIKLI